MNEPNFDTAYAIATQLSSDRTDHNELAKASTYLNQAQDPDDFFTWLEWMAAPRVSAALARSNRTPVYYQQIRGACRQLKTMPYPEDAGAAEKREIMAQTLAWAVRLMRYMPVAKPMAGADSLLFNQGRAATAKATATATGAPAKQPRSIRDLQPGMQLTGTVKRTAPFGAFVDVGVGRDGLLHVSKLGQGYVKEVESVAKQGETVTVWVEEVDAKQGRIGLTMIAPKGLDPVAATGNRDWSEAPTVETTPASSVAAITQPLPIATVVATTVAQPTTVRLTAADEVTEGLLVYGVVQRIEQNRILVDIGVGEPATLTFERLPNKPTDPDDVAEVLPAGSEIEVCIVGINKRGRVQLTLREA